MAPGWVLRLGPLCLYSPGKRINLELLWALEMAQNFSVKEVYKPGKVRYNKDRATDARESERRIMKVQLTVNKSAVNPIDWQGEISTPLMVQVNWDLEKANKELAKFAESVVSDPAYAMEWSEKYFKVAADHKVLTMIAAVLTEETPGTLEYSLKVEQLAEEMLSQVMNGAKWPSKSTSSSSNEMERAILAAKASWLEKLVE